MVPKGIKGKAFETVRKINGGNHKLMRQHLEYVDKANKVRRWRHPDLLNTTVARRKTTARFPDGLVKSYMDLGKSTTLAPPLERFTVFLKEDVSKVSALKRQSPLVFEIITEQNHRPVSSSTSCGMLNLAN